ncbi:MAG: GntP family permease [Planctomycetaceae bacterium]
MSPTLQTLLPAAAGIAVVVLGILVFRLHAFLALLLAAATTAALTPYQAIFHHELRKHSETFLRNDSEDEVTFTVLKEASRPMPGPWEQNYFAYGWNRPYGSILFSLNPRRIDETNPDRFVITADKNFVFHAMTPGAMAKYGMSFQVDDYSVHPDDYIVPATRYFDAEESAARSVPTRIAAAFGDTVGSIGLLIAFAAVIGMCLLDSGAADKIVRSALSVVGEKGAPLAFAGCGFLLGVPVFFDTVFLLMIPLGKAMRLRTGRNYILYVLTIYCGATMAHSLVPPTPGPLLVAEALGVEVGMMMAVGSAVGLITAGVGIVYALVVNRFIDVPLRDTPDMPLADLERLAAKPDHELPPLWLSLAPIVLPVWLIAQQTALELFLKAPPSSLAGFAQQIPPWFVSAVNVLGEKNTAVGIGVAIALFLLVWQTRQSLVQVRDRVGAALASGGLIILITAAGGAFGDMIEQTGVASLIKQMPALGPAGLLSVAFLVTTTIRTAQGSATVAMITAVGLFAGLDLPFHAVWLALAIGCGSKPISWMTDSGFWVICKMSGMTEVETLKTLTPMTVVMGVVGLVVVIVGATLFPMT